MDKWNKLKEIVNQYKTLAHETKESYEIGTPMRAEFYGMVEAFIQVTNAMDDIEEEEND